MQIILKNFKSSLALIHDIAAVCIAWVLAFLLRFNFEIPQAHVNLMIDRLWLVVVIQATTFIGFGLYRSTWRFASISDLKRIIFLVFFSTAIVGLLLFMIGHNMRVPRSVIILNPILLILIMGGSRFFYRSLKESQLYGSNIKLGEPVIILGAGEAAISLLKDLAQSEEWHVVGLLDDNKSLQGLEIQGVRVHGGIDLLQNLAVQYGVRHVIIAMPSVKHHGLRKALENVNHLEMEILTVPSINDLISGRLSISQIRPIDVEDLLGRDIVELDNSKLESLIAGKTIFVSGAGGSIGSELCRQIIKYKPDFLICQDISEYALYILEQEFSNKELSTKLIYVVGDVKNANRLNKIFKKYQPKVVFHAAAYKHVPLMETDNVFEALNNNVLGTYTLAKECKKSKVDKFVLVSTDKAVNPTNVMGATKQLAEMVCQGLQNDKSTRFIMVRFGNVLGSSGSVIPKFQEQIKAGGPITVTHPEITRYFMSIPEAAQLVMQAGIMGDGGEIFVLDMGKPVKIVDLAKDMIKFSGFAEDEISIEFSGLRPGEKLYEEPLADHEHSLPTSHKQLRIASAKIVDEKWVNDLLKWISTTLNKDEPLIKKELKTWVHNYHGDIRKR